jgi:hypothetical protein
MITRFLKAKHWVLFLLTFGIPMVFQFVIVGLMLSNLFTSKNSDSFEVFDRMKFIPIVMLVFMAVLYGWFWSIAIGLQKKVPVNVKMKVKKFKFFFLFPMIYFLLFMVFFFSTINSLFEQNIESHFGTIGVLFVMIIPIHLFAMFCIFYIFYFVAKTFKTVELQREVTFGDFAGEFFLLLFYPIGVWIIQPKINKMIEQ